MTDINQLRAQRDQSFNQTRIYDRQIDALQTEIARLNTQFTGRPSTDQEIAKRIQGTQDRIQNIKALHNAEFEKWFELDELVRTMESAMAQKNNLEKIK